MKLSQEAFDIPRSPEWWANRLSSKIIKKRPHYKKLDAYRSGKGGIPVLPQSLADDAGKYKWLRENALTNFGLLISDAVANRIKVVGFSSSETQLSREAQDIVWRHWKRARMQAVLADSLSDMFSLGVGYVFVGNDSSGKTVATSESPLDFYADVDVVNPDNVIAAGKFLYDDIDEKLRFYVYVDDSLYVFERDANSDTSWDHDSSFDSYDGWDYWDSEFDVVDSSWVLNTQLTIEEGAYPAPPIVVLKNKNGKGEFQDHLSLINRIQQEIFSKLLIIETGAWRKMVVLQESAENRLGERSDGLPQFDADGNEIDYRHVVPTSPGEISIMPPGTKIWESSQSTVDGILKSIDSDVVQLAAVTNTLVNYLLPDSSNQSASASEVSVSTFTSKVEERAERIRPGLEKVLSLILSASDDELISDDADYSVVYDNFKDASLSEAANADAQAESLPIETRQKIIWGMTDTEIAEARVAREQDEQRALALEVQRAGVQFEAQARLSAISNTVVPETE